VNLASLVEHNLREFGEYETTVFEGNWITNRGQAERSFRFANALKSLGVGPGDRVAVMLPNCPEVTQCYGAILRLGGVVVPVLFLLAAEELRLILSDSGAKAIVTSPEFVGKALDARANLDPEPPVVVVSGEVGGTLSYEALCDAESADAALVERDVNDAALFMYTSGTTGRPKGVMLSHGNMLHQADVADRIREDYERTDMTLAALPMAHAAGLVGWVLGLKVGSRGVLMRWFDAELFCRFVQEYGVAGTALVPTMAAFLLNHPAIDAYDLSSLKQVAFGAAPSPIELVRAFEEKVGCRVRIVYGLTEAAPILTVERLADERREGSVGGAIPEVEIAILHPESDAPLPSGEVGEICARGPNVMLGYHNLRDESERTLRGGWLHTGDLGYLDADGYLYVVDRLKDLIIRGGLNIYPHDVEEVLYAHPAVAEAAVVGVPDLVYGEEVVAFVVKTIGKDLTADGLLAFCRDRLAKYKTPKRVIFMPDLPKNQVGKVLKRSLREAAAKREAEV
jgi:long-chain acyl-CoA synthetase